MVPFGLDGRLAGRTTGRGRSFGAWFRVQTSQPLYYNLFGDKAPEDRASELVEYCRRHLRRGKELPSNHLYRIFYYDCPPVSQNVYHPLLQKTINLGKTETYDWSTDFLAALASKRKVAIRLGDLQERESGYKLKDKTVKALCRGEIDFGQVAESDFELNLVQKGVDMRIGLDIASIATRRLATQIVLIAGDSDFVPAAKFARREGIDFILDPMWQKVRPELNEHVDGLRSCVSRNPDPSSEHLCADYNDEADVIAPAANLPF